MNNDIKEIFDIWADEDGEIVVHYIDKNNNKQEYKMIESKDLLDYITNLQEENKKLKEYYNNNTIKYEDLIEKYSNLQEENEKLKKENTEYQDEIFTRDNNWYDMQD